MGAGTAAATLAGIELLKLLIKDLYQFASKKGKTNTRQFNVSNKAKSLYKNIEKIRKVKTIWQLDKTVDLFEFYCDTYFLTERKRRTIRNFSEFQTSENILIEGIAGQGKSIFLRYLCITELARGKYIPIFVELRRINEKQTLTDRICASCNAIGLQVDKDIFEYLSSTGKLLLLLDAFDEIPENLKDSTTTEIEDLMDAHPELKVVITSRPYQTIKSSRLLNTIKLDFLNNDEYENVVGKLSKNKKIASTLIEHIRKNSPHTKDTLNTPLMVTLLVLQYKLHSTLPRSLPEFYDSLFPTLFQRHDGTKPGFTRKRQTELTDSEYRMAFEALCFFARKANTQSFDESSMEGISAKALKRCLLKAKPSLFLNDIISITCLLLREGDDIRFIHKSVQEYYTSCFIRRSPETIVEKFYRDLSTSDSHSAWHQELSFLAETDSLRFKKHYYNPAALNFLNISQDLIDTEVALNTNPSLEAILKNSLFLFDSEHRLKAFYWMRGNFLVQDLGIRIVGILYKLMGDHKPDLNSIKTTNMIANGIIQTHGYFGVDDALSHNDDTIPILGYDLIRLHGFKDRIDSEYLVFCKRTLGNLRLHTKQIENSENTTILDNII